MKKFTAMLLVLVLALSLLTACGGSSADSDLKYIQDKGKIVVGITDYAPMDYLDENGEWTGFDAEFARLFADELGVECEFFVISDWGKMFLELETKQIDAVWNGMTITEEATLNASVTDPYVVNAQVLVMKADVINQYDAADKITGLAVAVENGSAGAEQLDALGIEYTALQTQANALMEVAAGASDACVIDLLMAGAMIGEGTSYPELTYTVQLNSEEYGVGFRVGSDLVEAFNTFWKKAYDAGTIMEVATTYGVQESIIGK